VFEKKNKVGEELTNTLFALVDREIIEPDDLVSLMEYSVYLVAMRLASGNQVRAAELLGVSKGTLRTKLTKYFSTTKVGNRFHQKELSFNESLQKLRELRDA
jgi:DNA-binding protein Fis